MKKALKKLAAILLILFVMIQFYQPARNISNGQVDTADFSNAANVPLEIANILRTSCYDCHSNHTNYLWYDYIQPARFLVEKHISDGKKELNFNEWGNYSERKQKRLLTSIKSQITNKEMPLPSYTLLRKNAKLTDKELRMLLTWLEKKDDVD
jgi:hypothetical protein